MVTLNNANFTRALSRDQMAAYPETPSWEVIISIPIAATFRE